MLGIRRTQTSDHVHRLLFESSHVVNKPPSFPDHTLIRSTPPTKSIGMCMLVSQRETVEYTGSILFLPMLRLSSGETSCRTSNVMHRFPTRKQRWKRGIVFPNHCVSPGSSTCQILSIFFGVEQDAARSSRALCPRCLP